MRITYKIKGLYCRFSMWTYRIAGGRVPFPVCSTLGDLTGYPIGHGIQDIHLPLGSPVPKTFCGVSINPYTASRSEKSISAAVLKSFHVFRVHVFLIYPSRQEEDSLQRGRCCYGVENGPTSSCGPYADRCICCRQPPGYSSVVPPIFSRQWLFRDIQGTEKKHCCTSNNQKHHSSG